MRASGPATFVSLVLLPIVSHAGNIYGSLWQDGKPLQAADIKVSCNGKNTPSKTDNAGAYRIFIKDTGRCTLEVSYNAKSGQIDIASYSNPTKYDFDVAVQGQSYVLKRR